MTAKSYPINDKHEILGWTMYDWANSAFSTTVITALLGPYIVALANSSETPLQLFGLTLQPTAIYPFAASASVFLQVFILPLLGAIADYTNLKKKMMLWFAYIGAVATMGLFFVQADMPVLGTNGAVVLASVLAIIANVCFGAAIVFYNAYLPEIASPDQRDKISSRGFAFGYAGGGLLLLINMGMLFLMPENQGLAVRLSLASAGVWWLAFTYFFPHRRLKQRESAQTLPEGESLITVSIRRLWHTLKEMYYKYPHSLRYLIAYLIYNDGIQTVIVVSTQFASDEIGMATDSLLLLVLMIQFVALGGALVFGWLAQHIGAKKSIMLSLVIWSGIVIYAYQFLDTETEVFVAGIAIGIVLGGSQALSRSLFSQMIPADKEAEYFGLYEISERGTSWLGPLAFGLVASYAADGSQRSAIISLIVFFVVGLILLTRVNVKKAMEGVGNDPSKVVL